MTRYQSKSVTKKKFHLTPSSHVSSPSVAVSACFENLTKSFWEYFALSLISSVWLYLGWSGDGGVKVTFVAVRLQTRRGSELCALPKCYNYSVS